MTVAEAKQVLKLSRQNPGTWFPFGDGWGVKTVREYNTPRGGPMAAWKYLYYLQAPGSANADLGGYDRADSFIAWAIDYMRRAA